MKTTLLFLSVFLSASLLSQLSNGTYVNEVNQKLVISNLSDSCFEFDVDWGVKDEWNCLFTWSGTAKFISANEAYEGNGVYVEDDLDSYNIKFSIEDKTIGLFASPMYFDINCFKFGDSFSEKYTLFQRTDNKKTEFESCLNVVLEILTTSPQFITQSMGLYEVEFAEGQTSFGVALEGCPNPDEDWGSVDLSPTYDFNWHQSDPGKRTVIARYSFNPMDEQLYEWNPVDGRLYPIEFDRKLLLKYSEICK